MKQIKRIKPEEIMFYIFSISFIFTFNLFFGIFVWNSSDLSPNQAIGFISLLYIGWIIYRWKKRTLEIKNETKLKKELQEFVF